jgi:hypothetical protein
MPLYYFVLKHDFETAADREGMELADHQMARDHAIAVARELMQHQEVRTRSWRLQVCDEDLYVRSEILFASVDNTLSKYPPEYRNTIQGLCRATGTLADRIADVRASLSQLKATLALAAQIR